MVKLLQPQEVEVFYILPAVRRELASRMKARGKSQKDIAKLLGITEPAVSQYMSSKRASLVKFNPAVTKAIHDSADRITNETSMLREMQRVMQVIHKERVICQVHESLGQVPKGCNACFEND